jgi:hypothetical protein
MHSIPGILRAAQFIDSEYRRGRLLSQNELVTILERETNLRDLLEAIQSEAARRAKAAGRPPADWQEFLWSEANSALNKVYE